MKAGPELFEKEIEDLLWRNLEGFVGYPLFPVARQPIVGDGLRPDLVALDAAGHVYVIEVKRDVDRRQLAQCLEYAGWARGAGLDDLAGMFHSGPDDFFSAWAEFTETDAPRLVQGPPRLILVARDFDGRTDAALSYLTESNLPITVLRVTVYEDQEGRRFVDIAADHEPDFANADGSVPGQESAAARYEIDGRRVTLGDLLDAKVLAPDAALTWNRPRVGATYSAVALADGTIQLNDGRVFTSPSRAAIEAAGVAAYDGWRAWQVDDGRSLADVRNELLNPAE